MEEAGALWRISMIELFVGGRFSVKAETFAEALRRIEEDLAELPSLTTETLLDIRGILDMRRDTFMGAN